MRPIPSAELAAFEDLVEGALERGDERGLDIIGYGEVTTVLALTSSVGRRAVKRMPPFDSTEQAAAYEELVARYLDALRAGGLEPVETELQRVNREGGRVVVYCVQPSLAPGDLAPAHVRELDEDAACSCCRRILDAIAGVVSDRLAPDGQLSNWAFVGERLLYLDVTTPFMRDEQGREMLDWEHQLQALPAVVRPAVRRWVAPHLLDKYYTLRGQIVDLLGNLVKERLEHLLAPFMLLANERFRFDPPIDEREVRRYYAGDARAYAFIQAARRADRWWQRHVRRRVYPYFLPPPIDRNV